MKIGLFGGTFDPVHIAHLILADETYTQLALSRLYWVLTPHPPHKDDHNITDMEQRLDMLLVAIMDNPNFLLSRVDIDRPRPHYAVDTVKIMKQKYPEAHIVYIMGGDSLHDLPSWHKPQEFVAQSDSIAVMRRPDDQVELKSIEESMPGITEKLVFIEAPLMEISGTKIRGYIRKNGPYRYYLPDGVYRLIQEKHIYR